MSNEDNKKSESPVVADPTIKTKLPAIDGANLEEVPAADLDEVAGGLAEEDCTFTCGTTKVSFARNVA